MCCTHPGGAYTVVVNDALAPMVWRQGAFTGKGQRCPTAEPARVPRHRAMHHLMLDMSEIIGQDTVDLLTLLADT